MLDHVTPGLPVLLDFREYRRFFPWLDELRLIPNRSIRKLNGNGQCLPLCGSLLNAFLFSIKLTEPTEAPASATEVELLEPEVEQSIYSPAFAVAEADR